MIFWKRRHHSISFLRRYCVPGTGRGVNGRPATAEPPAIDSAAWPRYHPSAIMKYTLRKLNTARDTKAFKIKGRGENRHLSRKIWPRLASAKHPPAHKPVKNNAYNHPEDIANYIPYIMDQGAYASAYSICRLKTRKEHAYV